MCTCVYLCVLVCTCVQCTLGFYCGVCVAPVITDYRHLASDPRPGNESIHGELVHNSSLIDSLSPFSFEEILTRLGEKHSKEDTLPRQIVSFDALKTAPAPFPPRQLVSEQDLSESSQNSAGGECNSYPEPAANTALFCSPK